MGKIQFRMSSPGGNITYSFWLMCSVPQWQKFSGIGDGVPGVAGPQMSWHRIGLRKGYGRQNGVLQFCC